MQLLKKIIFIISIFQFLLFVKCLNTEDDVYVHSNCVKKHKLIYEKYATCFLNGETCVIKCRSNFDQCYSNMGGNVYGKDLCAKDLTKCRDNCSI